MSLALELPDELLDEEGVLRAAKEVIEKRREAELAELRKRLKGLGR
jgi:hypothetical protein